MRLAMLVVLLASCAPALSAHSAAPPGRTARLDEVKGFWGDVKSYRLELSEGVALAIVCYQGGPCEKLTVSSDDREIAAVRPASLGTLEPTSFTNKATSAGFVVVGKAPGTTKLRVRTRSGGREIAVTVVAPPARSPPAAIANP